MTPNERALVKAAQEVFKAKDKLAKAARECVTAKVFIKHSEIHNRALENWYRVYSEIVLENKE